MDRAVLYLRLSKEDVDKLNKGDDSESIVNQRLLLTDYALEHDFQIVDVYSDDDYSGLYDDRPEFERLMRDAKIGKFDVVIAKSQSRFTRNMEHMERYLHHDFVLLGIRFIGVIDNVDTSVKGNKKARQIYGLTNEWYSEDLSENIRAVFLKKMRDGQFLGTAAPYGYLKDPEDGHKLIIDPEAAAVVQKIFRLYLEGYSVFKICHMLEDEKIPSPAVYKLQIQKLSYANEKAKYSLAYGTWSTTTVKRILKNETYLGKLIQHTVQKASYKDKRVVAVPKKDWIIVDAHHEAIIDKNTFDKVQQLQKFRRVDIVPGDKHVLSGKIKCANCGGNIVKTGPVRGDKSDRYMRCTVASKTRNKACTSHSCKYSEIYNAVRSNIQQIVDVVLGDDVHKQDVLKAVSGGSGIQKEIARLTKEIAKQKQQNAVAIKTIQKLYEDRINGILSDDIFLQLKAATEKKIKDTNEAVSQLQEQLAKAQEMSEAKNSLEETVKRYCDYSELTSEMVADFVDRVTVAEKDANGDREITIYWNF